MCDIIVLLLAPQVLEKAQGYQLPLNSNNFNPTGTGVVACSTDNKGQDRNNGATKRASRGQRCSRIVEAVGGGRTKSID